LNIRDRQATGAYVVTSGVFTTEVRSIAEGRKIMLVDDDALQAWIGQKQGSKKPQVRSG